LLLVLDKIFGINSNPNLLHAPGDSASAQDLRQPYPAYGRTAEAL